jgi:uncharacterized protein YndB with AHSA1/START domain
VALEHFEAVERQIRIDARPATVFAFFCEPELMLRWKGVEATLEPVPGGTYRVVMHDRATVLGRYVEVEPPTRVVFTWGFAGDDALVAPGGSTVEVTLTPDGDGTLVRVVHRGLTPASRPPHDAGWAHYLERLRTAAEGRDPGPDPWADND